LSKAIVSSSSEATLVAVTAEAQRALGGTREIRVTQFPFRVGRERRSSFADDWVLVDVPERRRGKAPQLNDVYLRDDESRALQISRAHFALECIEDRFFLVDRGSACGMIVSGRRIGGHRKAGRTELRDGDEVIVGTGRSPYVFRFVVAANRAAS
jgi:pSer/pThr/pTyr-binding forkhead associated (FHA) protein